MQTGSLFITGMTANLIVILERIGLIVVPSEKICHFECTSNDIDEKIYYDIVDYVIIKRD